MVIQRIVLTVISLYCSGREGHQIMDFESQCVSGIAV
jgi:hypothetical protein